MAKMFYYNKVPKAISDVFGLRVDSLPLVKSGVYFLVLGHKVVYIGSSKNIIRRVSQHMERGINFEKVFYHLCEEHERFSIEAELINLIKPELNLRITSYIKKEMNAS